MMIDDEFAATHWLELAILGLLDAVLHALRDAIARVQWGLAMTGGAPWQ